MVTKLKTGIILVLLIAGAAGLTFRAEPGAAQGTPEGHIFGRVIDTHGQPVAGVKVSLLSAGESDLLAVSSTQPDGSYALALPEGMSLNGDLQIEAARAHFASGQILLDGVQGDTLRSGSSLVLADLSLQRKIGPAFWLTTLIFILVLVLLATGKVHNTLSTLLGVALLFGTSYLGEPASPDLFIFTFQRALVYIDWNVIFLILGMMIVIAVIERTGIFHWLAFFAYRLSHGRVWLLAAILMVFTGVTSAFLDNVTTMLLMTPITIQIALALDMNPLALLMPEVMASNVVGISTLIGTPTNILIGSYAAITFDDFLLNLTPGVLLALVGLMIYTELTYRRDYATSRDASEQLVERLAERARITQPGHLRKAAWVGAGMLLLFLYGEHLQMLPAVTGLMGATALLVWIRPDMEEMIEAVDWTTLVFFIMLFILVGSIREVGLVSVIADFLGSVVGTNLWLAMVVITYSSALLSMVIANIPFTAAMLPVIGFLSVSIPGADSRVLFFCLSIGSAMGGNGSLIGASANMVTAGIAERAGYPMSYAYFLKKGLPALFITVSLAMIWLLARFL